MAYKCDILLGRIIKVSGYEGAVAIKLEKNFIENIPEMESVFLEIEGRPVPFFIDSIDYSGADLLKLQFEGYPSNEKISEFVGCRIFLAPGTHSEEGFEENPDLSGYKVYIAENELLGTISEIVPNRGQWLINVRTAGKKSILIPLHEDFIISVDREEKVIIMDLPDGLIDLN